MAENLLYVGQFQMVLSKSNVWLIRSKHDTQCFLPGPKLPPSLHDQVSCLTMKKTPKIAKPPAPSNSNEKPFIRKRWKPETCRELFDSCCGPKGVIERENLIKAFPQLVGRLTLSFRIMVSYYYRYCRLTQAQSFKLNCLNFYQIEKRKALIFIRLNRH